MDLEGGQNMPICELPSSFFDAQWQYEGHPAARPFWHGVRPRVEVVAFGGQKTAVTQKGQGACCDDDDDDDDEDEEDDDDDEDE